MTREDLYQRNPPLGKLGEQLASKLTEQTVIDLNGRVDLDGLTAGQAAAEFLRANGFIA